MHEFISKNEAEAGRDFAVGDIHGCYSLLREALKYEGFDETKDRLFSVGDIIDRGPESEECLSLLQEPWFFMVRGNHEQMCIEAYRLGGGESWWASYGSWAKWIDPSEMENLAKAFDNLPVSMTLDCEKFSVGLCHAEPDGQDWKNNRANPRSQNVMLWGRKVLSGDIQYDVEGVDITLHGHTPLEAPNGLVIVILWTQVHGKAEH